MQKIKINKENINRLEKELMGQKVASTEYNHVLILYLDKYSSMRPEKVQKFSIHC